MSLAVLALLAPLVRKVSQAALGPGGRMESRECAAQKAYVERWGLRAREGKPVHVDRRALPVLRGLQGPPAGFR